MPAFDKNSVQLEYAYVINPLREENVELQPCPRCGSMEPRKHRSVCLSCKHRIPPIAARNTWENPLKQMYKEEVIEAPIKQQVSFTLVKGGKWDAIRLLRKLAVNLVIVGVVVAAVPTVLQMALGETAVNKMKDEIAALFSGTPGAQVAEVFLHRQKAQIQ